MPHVSLSLRTRVDTLFLASTPVVECQDLELLSSRIGLGRKASAFLCHHLPRIAGAKLMLWLAWVLVYVPIYLLLIDGGHSSPTKYRRCVSDGARLSLSPSPFLRLGRGNPRRKKGPGGFFSPSPFPEASLLQEGSPFSLGRLAKGPFLLLLLSSLSLWERPRVRGTSPPLSFQLGDRIPSPPLPLPKGGGLGGELVLTLYGVRVIV